MSNLVCEEIFTRKFATVKENILTYCKKSITDNWDNSIDMWLRYDADWEFSHGFYNVVEKEFSEYMTSKIEDTLRLAGKHTKFAVSSFVEHKENVELGELLRFTEKFVSTQLDEGNFDNWCGDIYMAMHEEISE